MMRHPAGGARAVQINEMATTRQLRLYFPSIAAMGELGIDAHSAFEIKR
jgi:hypothetical protein